MGLGESKVKSREQKRDSNLAMRCIWTVLVYFDNM